MLIFAIFSERYIAPFKADRWLNNRFFAQFLFCLTCALTDEILHSLDRAGRSLVTCANPAPAIGEVKRVHLMFTGIVTDIGEIRELERRGDLRARIGTHYDTATIDIGASIACDGVCLTVIALGDDWFDVEISAESVAKTNISAWDKGAPVNLERALRVGDELGGHIVSGHIDGVAKITDMADEGGSTRMIF